MLIWRLLYYQPIKNYFRYVIQNNCVKLKSITLPCTDNLWLDDLVKFYTLSVFWLNSIYYTHIFWIIYLCDVFQVTYMYYTGRLEVFNENFSAVSNYYFSQLNLWPACVLCLGTFCNVCFVILGNSTLFKFLFSWSTFNRELFPIWLKVKLNGNITSCFKYIIITNFLKDITPVLYQPFKEKREQNSKITTLSLFSNY